MNATRQQIAAVPTVQFTKTWRPIHHNDVLHAIDTNLERSGLEVLNNSFQLSADGKDLFGTISIEKGGHDVVGARQTQIGFRNSMKKNFSLGFVAGDRIMVCSNMCFFGEFQDYHRHDNTLTMNALDGFTGEAIETVLGKHNVYRAWFDTLTSTEMTDRDLKVITYNAMEQGIINPSNFNTFRTDYELEVNQQRDFDYEHTIGHFHGAVTRNLRGSSVNQQMQKTRRLQPLIDNFIGDLEVMTPLNDFLV